MDLYAQGAQDQYLTRKTDVHGNVTIGKTAHEGIELERCKTKITFDGYKCQRDFVRHGDVVDSIWFMIELPDEMKSLYQDPTFPFCLIDKIYWTAGGQIIQQWDGRLLYMKHLMEPPSKREIERSYHQNGCLFIPMETKVNGIPLVAMQYHQATIHVELTSRYISQRIRSQSVYEVIYNTIPQMPDDLCHELTEYDDCKIEFEVGLTLQAGYTYLDGEPRRRLATTEMDHHILQYQSQSSDCSDIDLQFGHTMSRLLFVIEDPKKPFHFYNTDNHPLQSAKFSINNASRSEGNAAHFHVLDKVRTGQCVPEVPVYTITFQNPKEVLAPAKNPYHGSSTLNFSRIDRKLLQVQRAKHVPKDARVYVYGENFNILRVHGGMAGVAFAS